MRRCVHNTFAVLLVVGQGQQ